MKRLVASLCLAVSFMAQAQDQFAVRFNHSGIMALMKQALVYNNRGTNSAGFKIPAGIYSFKIPRAQVASNPIIRLVSEVSDVSLVRDYPFYLYNSQINVVGEIDQTSLRHTVSNQSAQGFNLQVTLDVPQLRMTIPEMSLCEKKAGARCGNGLKASFKNSSIALRRGSVIRLVGKFRVDINNSQARVRTLSVTSNLGAGNGPRIDINAGQLTIPPVVLTVNGQSAELDTSSLRGQLLRRTDFLANKLLGFAGDFIAEDLAALINRTLRNDCVPTQLNVVNMEPRPVAGRPLVVGITQGNNFGARFQSDVARLIKSARFDLALRSILTPESKNLELKANGGLRINGKRWQVGNRLSNGTHTLPALDLAAHIAPQVHYGVAISEPVVNGALELLNGTGLFQELVETAVDTRGLYVKYAKVHFRSNPDRFYVVVGTEVNLREINSDGVLSWIKNTFAAWVERNNNDSKLYFPMQFEIVPRMVRLPNGQIVMAMRVNSPFAEGTTIRNYFGYGTNITQATNSVRKGVLEKVRDGLLKYVNTEFAFRIDHYLNQKGMDFSLRGMRVVDSAYLVLGLDLNSINLAALNSGGGSCR